MAKRSGDYRDGLGKEKLPNDSNKTIYPANRFEVDTLDQHRVVLTVHYFPSPEDYAKNQSQLLRFLLPVSGVAPLANLLNRVVQDLGENTSRWTQ